MSSKKSGHTVSGGDSMCHRWKQDKKDEEDSQRKENLDKFNAVTKSVKPENQNQTHNVRKEGINPINQKR